MQIYKFGKIHKLIHTKSCLENSMDRGAWQATVQRFGYDRVTNTFIYILNPTLILVSLPFLIKTSFRFSLVAKSSLTLCDPMDCRQPGSSVHGILQSRILEWFATSFSMGSSQPRG